MVQRVLLLVAALSAPLAAQVASGPTPPSDPLTDRLPQQSAVAPVQPPAASTTADRRRVNPYGRDIDMTVPLEQREKVIGQIPIMLTHDGQVEVVSAPFILLMSNLLNDAGKGRLSQALAHQLSFSPAELLGSAGITVLYDPAGLTLTIAAIDPTLRAVESLFRRPTDDEGAPDIEPAHFSAFLNASVVENHLWSGTNRGFRDPSVYFNGAIRLGGVVFEADGQMAQRDTLVADSPYRFDRNYARFVFDQPSEFRRFYAGDLTPEIRGQQDYVQMGGVGVSRQRRRFDQFFSAVLQGNRNLILPKEATVDVYRNGSLYQQFHLSPGSYDLSSLPLITGSNDVKVEVRDPSGVVQSLNYQSYLDPIDLEPGDYEYSAYVGRLSDRIGQSPVYHGDVAFSGFYRKAFLDRPSAGVGLQLSSKVQQLTGQTQFVVLGGSRLLIEGGVSHAKSGGGYTTGISLEKIINRSDLIDSVTLQSTFQSRRFAGLGDSQPDNSSSWSLTALYSHAVSREVIVLGGANYLANRGGTGSTYRVFADSSYRFSKKWRVQGGVSYSRFGTTQFSRGGFGLNFSLVFQPSFANRAEVRADTGLGSSEASFLHSGSNQIGSVGYGAIASRELGAIDAQAFVDYTGNRFDAALSHATFGSDFSHVTDRQITSLRVSSSIVFADGQFGVGRRVGDSFALLYPHATLEGHAVVAGQSIAENEYLSRSGALGGAVNGYLASYVTQSVQYDVENPPVGYDVGSGVVRVHPAYHSGYKLRIGTDAFVSAVGTLVQSDGAPMVLASGSVTSLDREEPQRPFFTNSVGRFAVQNLRLGEHYRIDVFGKTSPYRFDVPKDSKGLVDLHTVGASVETTK